MALRSIRDFERADRMSLRSKMSTMTAGTRKSRNTTTTSGSTPSKSARYLYLNALQGRQNVVLRPHPRNMVNSLMEMALHLTCSQQIKEPLVRHVERIKKLLNSNRKAGTMLNKSMMYWRILLKRTPLDVNDVMKMIDDVEDEMDRIRLKLRLSDDCGLVDQLLPTQLYQLYMEDGLRIVTFNSNDKIIDYVKKAKSMRRTVDRLQKTVNSSMYFDNVKEWMMDAAIKVNLIMAIDTIVAISLKPYLKELQKNTRDGNLIQTQYVNRLRTFNVILEKTLIEAKRRRCLTMKPLDDILTKMNLLDNRVRNRQMLKDIAHEEYPYSISELKDNESKTTLSDRREFKRQMCQPVELRDFNTKIYPPDLFPAFV